MTSPSSQHDMALPARTIVASAMDAAAFSPFGEVIAHPGGNGRHFAEEAFKTMPRTRPALWINNPAPVALPLAVERLERHPQSEQTFLPLTGARYLAAVCEDDAQGSPDLSTLAAFVIEGPVGVTYRRGVWHHGLAVLDVAAKFAVIMSETAQPDTQWHVVEEEIWITIPK